MRVLAIALIAWSLCASPAHAEGPPLARGVALHGPLTWGRTTPGGAAYAWPVYEGTRYDVPVNLLREVKAAGFDFVRLSVDPGPFIAFGGEKREMLYQHMADIIGAIRRAGLDVLVDFHPIGMVKAYSHEHVEGDLLPAYTVMIRESARRLSRMDTAHIAIEPMNEPQLGYHFWERAQCQSMMARFHDAIRAESKTLTIVIGGGRGGSIDGLTDLNPRPLLDAHTRFSFHYYLPYVFTHQGVQPPNKYSRIWPFTVGLPYPATASGFGQFWPQVEQRVQNAEGTSPSEKADILADGQQQLQEYFAKTGNAAAIHAGFDRVTAWATKNGVNPQQILLGEFGVTQSGPHWGGAAPEDRAHWISDVRKEAEAQGFGWSFWALCGSAAHGMTLVMPADPARIDPLTAKALGKKP